MRLAFLPVVRTSKTCSGARSKDQLIRRSPQFAGPARHDKLQRHNSPSRRIHSRVEATDGVYVYWRSADEEDVAPVRNLSMGGLFIETKAPKPPGASAKLNFLVQEGQIRADAIVRHIKPGGGLGLRFTAVQNEDRQRLAELLKRLRSLSLAS